MLGNVNILSKYIKNNNMKFDVVGTSKPIITKDQKQKPSNNVIYVITDATEEIDDEAAILFLTNYVNNKTDNEISKVRFFYVGQGVNPIPKKGEDRNNTTQRLLKLNSNDKVTHHSLHEVDKALLSDDSLFSSQVQLHIIQIGPINTDNTMHLKFFIENISPGYSYYLLGKLGTTINSQPIGNVTDPKDNAQLLFNTADNNKRFILDSGAPHCLFFTNIMIGKLEFIKLTEYADQIKKIMFRNTVCRGGPPLLVRTDIGSNYKTVNALFKANNNNKSIDESFKEVLQAANAANANTKADKIVIDKIFEYVKKQTSTELQNIFPIPNFAGNVDYNEAYKFISNIMNIENLVKGDFHSQIVLTNFKASCNYFTVCQAFYLGLIQIYYALHKLKLVNVTHDFKIFETESFETNEKIVYNETIKEKWNGVISNKLYPNKSVQISPIYDLTAILYCLNNIKKGNTETNNGDKTIPSNLKLQNPETPEANNDALDKYFKFNDELVNFYETKLNPPKAGGKGKRQHNPMNSPMRDFIQGGGDPNSKRNVNQYVKNILKNNQKLSQKVLDYANNNA